MKITKLGTFHVKPRWMFLKISTDEGICGWGEPVVEGRARTVEMAINELRPVLIGADPMRIEHLWQTMYCTTFYRGGPILTSCISGIEQALWDIKGKKLGAPVYELIGGRVRDKIRMYSHTGGDTPEQAAANAKKRVEQGFDAVKISPDAPVKHIDHLSYVDALAEKFCAIREAVGKGVDIAIDFHGRIHAGMASRLIDAIAPYYPMFVEEPVLPENVEVMASIAAKTSVPIATGERLFTKWAFRNVLEEHAAVVLQPDTCHCGGIFEVRKIASMAEMYYASVAPHNPLGHFDAVLMDIRMPEMDGLSAASRIRALDRPDARAVPILAMTADAFGADVQRALAAGMNDHLAKPIEPAQLYRALACQLRRTA